MRYLSVCSGIEAATIAWHPLGWVPAAFSEIEAFPRSVLKHHYPHVPLHGDFTTIKGDEYGPINLLVGGTPCQDYSIAGLRAGLDGDRGNLTLEYARLARRLGVDWFVWENVPGCLSTNSGCDFGAIIATFAGYPEGYQFKTPEGGWRNSGIVPAGSAIGYGLAWRVLDAQYFGVPQRRRRVFVIGYTGDWRRAAAVLFERESLRRDITPSREKRKEVAGTIGARTGLSIGAQDANCGHMIAKTLVAGSNKQYPEIETFITTNVAHTLRAEHDASEDGSGRGLPIIATAIPIHDKATRHKGGGGTRKDDGSANGLGIGRNGYPMPTLDTAGRHSVAYRVAGDGVAYHQGDLAASLTTGTDSSASVVVFDLGQLTSPENRSKADPSAPCPTLNTAGKMSIAAFKAGQGSKAGGIGYDENLAPTLGAAQSGSNLAPSLLQEMAVRRLIPLECERLQGMPDNYTRIPGASNGGWRDVSEDEDINELQSIGLPVKLRGNTWRVKDPDGPRYKAIGNSMAVPVMRWIGERIQLVESMVLTGGAL